jgi:RNA polymerase sigma-70 factor (ECF subfamily)
METQLRKEPDVMSLKPAFRDAMLEAVPSLRAFSLLLCLDDDKAENLVREARLRVCGHMRSSDHGTSMRTLLFTNLRNRFYSEWQSRLKTGSDYADTVVPKLTKAAQSEHDEFYRALAVLRSAQREALVLVEASGLSYEEAAQVCGCRIETIMSRVIRARAELTRLLTIDDPADSRKIPSGSQNPNTMNFVSLFDKEATYVQ